MDEMTLTLNNPLTEEEWDLIEDVDFDKTNSIEFHTKHGKTVKFVKCTDERTGDQISRQAAVDEFPEDALPWDTFDGYIAPHHVRKILKQLPSVQPDVPDTNVGDMISREMVIDILNQHYCAIEQANGRPVTKEEQKFYFALKMAFAWLPSAQPEVEQNTPPEHGESDKLGVKMGETCTDTISKKAAIEYFVTNVGFHDEDGYPIDDSDELRKIWTEYFDGIPSAQPKRHKGKWNTYYHSDIEFSHSCNQCGYSAPYQMIGGKVFQKKWNFCPSCGADMRGERP